MIVYWIHNAIRVLVAGPTRLYVVINSAATHNNNHYFVAQENNRQMGEVI